MLTNYLKIAWRNLVRNKSFSAINIAGLGLGMACSLLIMLWIQDERKVDGFHANGRELYQVYERNFYDGKVDAVYQTQGLLADELKRVIPGVLYACGMEAASAPGTASTFEAGQHINKMAGSFSGADFFKMFSFPLLQGDAETALKAPGSVAISRKMAEQFFGSIENAFGKTIRYENKEDLQVTAVFENLPATSSVQFEFLRSWTDFVKANEWVQNWSNTSPATYIQLRKGAEPAKVENELRDFIYRYKEKNEGSHVELALQPYTEKYLHSTFKNGYVNGGRIEYVRLFTIVAFFILVIACINFMNLATAQSAKRAREVGLRKVIGAMRISLFKQFIGEAMLLTFCAVLVALAVAGILLPGFNSLTGKQLTLPFQQPLFWVSLVALVSATGFVAGSYPALYLSSLNPVRVLKGSLKFNWSSIFFRKGLVVFQFTLSIVLIVGMIVIYRQMDYIKTKNIGYDRENLVYIPIEGDLAKNYAAFKAEAQNLPGILAISKMRNSPTVIEHHTGNLSWPGKDQNLVLSIADGVVGYDFVKTMKLSLVEGRDFSKEFGTDSTGFLLNESAAKKIGFKQALGQTLLFGNRPGKVVGVLKDFHFNSLHQTIEPLVLRLNENWTWGTILVRTEAGKTNESIAGLEKLCKQINPRFPFTYQFSDEEFTKLYKSEEVVSGLFNFFAFLAFFISCLGLFGLSTFTAAQRTREIGVRKVLGASVSDIIGMLSGNFLKLVGIAILIGFPVAWLVMNLWLQNFAYKTSIEWWMFALASGVAISVALITVSFQAIKAAVANPVRSLRTE